MRINRPKLLYSMAGFSVCVIRPDWVLLEPGQARWHQSFGTPSRPKEILLSGSLVSFFLQDGV